MGKRIRGLRSKRKKDQARAYKEGTAPKRKKTSRKLAAETRKRRRYRMK